MIPPPDSFISALGGNTLRTLGAAAAISLLALASFGVVLVMEVPYTAHDASGVALEKGTSDIYAWKCPDGKGGYTDEILVMNILVDAFQRSMERDIIRSSNVFEACPVPFVESDYYVQKVAEHILSKTGDCIKRGYVHIHSMSKRNADIRVQRQMSRAGVGGVIIGGWIEGTYGLGTYR